MTRSIVVALSVLCMLGATADAEVRKDPPEDRAPNGAQTLESKPLKEMPLLPENDSVEGLEIEETADWIRVHLQGRFQHALIAVITPDGSSVIECVDSADRAAELLGTRSVSLTHHDESPREK